MALSFRFRWRKGGYYSFSLSLTAWKLVIVIIAAVIILGEYNHGSIVTIAALGGKCTISSGSCTMFFFFGSPTLAPYSVSFVTRILVILLPAFSLNSPQFLLSGLGGCFSSQDIPYTEASKLGKVFEQVRGLSEEVHGEATHRWRSLVPEFWICTTTLCEPCTTNV